MDVYIVMFLRMYWCYSLIFQFYIQSWISLSLSDLTSLSLHPSISSLPPLLPHPFFLLPPPPFNLPTYIMLLSCWIVIKSVIKILDSSWVIDEVPLFSSHIKPGYEGIWSPPCLHLSVHHLLFLKYVCVWFLWLLPDCTLTTAELDYGWKVQTRSKKEKKKMVLLNKSD